MVGKWKKILKTKSLKASATIEAAVVVPFFALMVVQIVISAIHCHDQAIVYCVSSKICMSGEYGYRTFDKENRSRLREFSDLGNAYIYEKTLSEPSVLELTSSVLEIRTEHASILRNDPVDYVWMTDAAAKLLKDKGESQ